MGNAVTSSLLLAEMVTVLSAQFAAWAPLAVTMPLGIPTEHTVLIVGPLGNVLFWTNKVSAAVAVPELSKMPLKVVDPQPFAYTST